MFQGIGVRLGMKRIFLFNETLVPIADYDFRVTVVALQSVRGAVIERKGWPDHLDSSMKHLVNFLDLPIGLFLEQNEDFGAYESRYQTRIRELTGHQSNSKNFSPAGKTFRDFAEHRLGTTIEGALFHAILDLHRNRRASIPSLDKTDSVLELLTLPVTGMDQLGLIEARETILNPLLETGPKIVQMNPSIDKEFPNMSMIAHHSSVGKTFGDVVSEATYSTPIQVAVL